MEIQWSKPRYILWLALGLTIGLRLFFIHIQFFNVDEAVSAVAANAILDGGLPYLDAIDHRGPLTYYAYSLIFAIWGKNHMVAVHWIYLFLTLVITGLVWLTGYQIKGNILGSWSALLFAVFTWTNPFHEMWAAHTEWLLLLFTLLGINTYLFYWRLIEKLSGWKKVLLLMITGFFLGMAVLSKQVAALDLAAIMGFIFISTVTGNKHLRQSIGECLLLSLGWVIPIGMTIFYFWWHQALEDFYFYVWQYNTEYYLPQITWADRLEAWAKLWGGFLINKWLLFVLWGVAFMQALKWKKIIQPENQPLFFIFLWLAATIFEALSGSRAFLHYLIPALPAMVIIAAWALIRVIDSLKTERIDLKAFVYGVMIIGLCFPIIYTFIQYRDIIDHDASITEFKDLTTYVEANSWEEETIFVWGFAPEIYVLSNRKPASRYSFCNVLTGYLPAVNEDKENTDELIVPGTWEIFIKELQTNQPRFIIDTQPGDYRAYGKYPMNRYRALNEFLNQYYKKDSLFQQNHPSVIFDLYKRIEHP